jgi:hypothetical protein
MAKRALVFLLGWILLLGFPGARGEWIERESRTEPSGATGLVHQHLVIADSASGSEVTLELARFSPRECRFRLIDNPNGRDLAAAVDSGHDLAAANGGYFDEKFAPLGLRIVDGTTTAPLTRGRLLSGVIISTESKTQILRASEYSRSLHPRTALQCGPFLVDRSRTVAGLNSSQRARRTFVGITETNQVVLGFSSSVSLAQLSSILASRTDDLKTQRALNLDGGSSSAFWFRRKDGSVFAISEQKSVRDFIAVTPH